MLAVLVLAFLGALAASHRGFTGTISHAFHSLTDTHAKVPNTPGRLTAIASVRAQYWDEALKVFKAHPALGVGAGGYEVARLRYRTGPLPVKHAHGFIVQTLADLGHRRPRAGAACCSPPGWRRRGAPTHPFNRRWRSWAELRARRAARLGAAAARQDPPLRTGADRAADARVHGRRCSASTRLMDWTWYVPGTALAALLCAGWLAGRGPLLDPAVAHRRRRALERRRAASRERDCARGDRAPGRRRASPSAGAIVGDGAPDRLDAVAAAALRRSARKRPRRSSRAIRARRPQRRAARCPATRCRWKRCSRSRACRKRQAGAAQARATLERAVRLQPSNPRTWLALGRFDLAGNPQAAVAGDAGRHLPRPGVDLAGSAHGRDTPKRRDLRRLRAGAARRRAAGSGRQNRDRTALASKSRRAPGGPAARRTESRSKPNEVMQRAESRAVVVAQMVALRVEARGRRRRARARLRAAGHGPAPGW